MGDRAVIARSSGSRLVVRYRGTLDSRRCNSIVNHRIHYFRVTRQAYARTYKYTLVYYTANADSQIFNTSATGVDRDEGGRAGVCVFVNIQVDE